MTRLLAALQWRDTYSAQRMCTTHAWGCDSAVPVQATQLRAAAVFKWCREHSPGPVCTFDTKRAIACLGMWLSCACGCGSAPGCCDVQVVLHIRTGFASGLH